jgi:hypothetical protein
MAAWASARFHSLTNERTKSFTHFACHGTKYPFLREIELFTATGDCYAGLSGCGSSSSSERDLFVDPAAPSRGTNYSSLLAAVGNVVASGLRSYLVVANVPVALSASHKVGTSVSTMRCRRT